MKRYKNRLLAILLSLITVFSLGGCLFEDIDAIAKGEVSTEEPFEKVSDEDLQVHFLSVGQGDSELIKLPTGENILIDAGDRDCGDFLVEYLKNEGIEKFDMVVATHPHSDHIGSMQDVLENFEVEKIFMSDYDYDTMTYTNLLYSIEENEVERIVAKQGEIFEIGDAIFEVLGPVKVYEDCNNNSIVLMMQYGENRFLFTGDMETESEKDILSMGYNVRADVLKIAHHGSLTSSSTEFIKAVRADYGIIEVGEGNDYGLPKDEVVMNIARTGTTVFRTDRLGTIIVTSDGEKINTFFERVYENYGGTSSTVTEETEEIKETKFIGNINSKVFHSTDCKQLPDEKNRVEFDSLQTAKDEGYRPHSGCVEEYE